MSSEPIAAVRIRPVAPGDAAAVVELVRGLADFEHLDGPDAEAAGRFAADLADPGRIFDALVAETPEGLVGFALYFFAYSTFRGRPTLYIEDLFVVPHRRSRRIGRALFLACARIAAQRGCGRLEWSVLHWNEDAQRFYRRLGGAPSPDWQPWGMSADAIAALAAAPLADHTDLHEPSGHGGDAEER